MKPMPALRKAPGLSPETLASLMWISPPEWRIDAGRGAHEFALALAFDARQTDDFAGMHDDDRPDRSPARSNL